MKKTSKIGMTKKGRDLMRSARKSPDASTGLRALGADWTAIGQKVLWRAKKSPLGRRAGELLSNGWLHPTAVDVKSL
jgi:hypothetical protein